jgi:hypothetical protein
MIKHAPALTREQALNLRVGDSILDTYALGYESGTWWVVCNDWEGGFPIMVRSGPKRRMVFEYNLCRYHAVRPRWAEDAHRAHGEGVSK